MWINHIAHMHLFCKDSTAPQVKLTGMAGSMRMKKPVVTAVSWIVIIMMPTVITMARLRKNMHWAVT